MPMPAAEIGSMMIRARKLRFYYTIDALVAIGVKYQFGSSPILYTRAVQRVQHSPGSALPSRNGLHQ